MALVSPIPTAAPPTFIVQRKILERQAVTTCGWVNGIFSSPVTCAAGFSCAQNTINSVHFCCSNLNDCTLPTTCLDSTAVNSGCNDACLANASILKCTGVAFPYCYTRYWNESPPLSGFGCAASAFTQSVETTYANQVASATAGGPSIAAPTAASSNTFGGTSNSSTPGTTGSSSTNSTSTGLSTGAIAGIVVGAVIGLIVVVGGLIGYLIYRYKTKDARELRRRRRDANKREAERIKLEALALKTRPDKLVLPSHNNNGPPTDVSPGESASQYGGSTVVGPSPHINPSQVESRPPLAPPSALSPFPSQPAAGYFGPTSPSSDTSRPPAPPPSM
ncbi:hypothetical protein N7G274_002447 [Stereocaulon virgatum]|uniref:Uncharacterized protein n=1 Tax=Stereocaulon virgatum TaxID=373712 RepID=A0ABR4AHV3_9LECA